MTATAAPRRPCVLMVDDDVVQHVIVEEALAREGWRLLEAESGTRGLELLQSEPVDLVLLDVMMPGLDGFETCRRIRASEDWVGLPVIMFTALDDEASIEGAYNAGATHFITKPINPVLLRHQVRYLLRAGGIEEALRSAKLSAEAASRTKAQILHNIGHELRTPLNAVIGFAELMASEALGPLGADPYREYADDIVKGARRLLTLINDILDYANVDAGQEVLSCTDVALGGLLEEIGRGLRQRAAGAGLSLATVVAGALPPVHADPRKLRQALLHLLDNAIKFTPPGGRVELRAALVSSREVAVSVADTGCGIPEDRLNDAVTPFRQGDNGLSRRFDGVGLGLPLARALVEAHGGRLRLDSRPDRGTTVTLTLPVQPALTAEPARGVTAG